MKPWHLPGFFQLLDLAVMEDLSTGDVTSNALIPDNLVGYASLTAKSGCVIAGQEIAHAVFSRVDSSLIYSTCVQDGQKAEAGQIIASVEGNLLSILAAERTALNFLQRFCGIATMTRHYVQLINNSTCKIVDTRKTAPGYRLLDKYAVRQGGGYNHRFNLGDGILIKDNHIKACGSISAALLKARKNAHHTIKIQIEVTCSEDAAEAVNANADALLLDNMDYDSVKSIVDRYGNDILVECSGNISDKTIKQYADTGVHIISVGALTHSVSAADISLNIKA
jgi:nicotinate-nucleotide pyrophosphorylase (carboxylating)